jgi:DNA mismatch endonuclease, patch repair protein
MGKTKSKDEVARNMRAIRSANNKSETQLRRVLHRRGMRYRKYHNGLVGKPDIVFPRAKLVVFVDGDYWHARTAREYGIDYFCTRLTTPNDQSRDYWRAKMLRNMARDDFVTAELQAAGWTVLRFWETDVKMDLEATADIIADRLNVLLQSQVKR